MSFRIAVGSTNPAKTTAVKTVCEQAFPGCTVMSVDVPSGVRAQPIGADETSTGARNRARAALEAVQGARMGLGIEGGMDPGGDLIHCVAVVGDDGRENLTWGVRFALPPIIVERILRGEEVSVVVDELTRRTDSKKHMGAVGILTNGIFTRTEMMHGPLACALIPFLHSEFYPLSAM